MRNKRRSYLSLSVIIVPALLLSLGLAYGLWSKTLAVRGTMETGTVHAEWIGAGCFEFHTWPDLPDGIEDLGELEGKDVGSTTVTIDPEDPQILHLVVQNGYPSYAVDCEVHYVNNGSIPVIISGTDIRAVSPNLTNCVLSGDQTKVLTCDQLTVVFADGIGAQLDPNGELASSLRLHVEQPAEQDSTFRFQVRVCMAQWNEPATFEECAVAAPHGENPLEPEPTSEP